MGTFPFLNGGPRQFYSHSMKLLEIVLSLKVPISSRHYWIGRARRCQNSVDFISMWCDVLSQLESTGRIDGKEISDKVIGFDLLYLENLCTSLPRDFLAIELHDFFYVINSTVEKPLDIEAQSFWHQESCLKAIRFTYEPNYIWLHPLEFGAHSFTNSHQWVHHLVIRFTNSRLFRWSLNFI